MDEDFHERSRRISSSQNLDKARRRDAKIAPRGSIFGSYIFWAFVVGVVGAYLLIDVRIDEAAGVVNETTKQLEGIFLGLYVVLLIAGVLLWNFGVRGPIWFAVVLTATIFGSLKSYEFLVGF